MIDLREKIIDVVLHAERQGVHTIPRSKSLAEMADEILTFVQQAGPDEPCLVEWALKQGYVKGCLMGPIIQRPGLVLQIKRVVLPKE